LNALCIAVSEVAMQWANTPPHSPKAPKN